jgi:hypothetical protein
VCRYSLHLLSCTLTLSLIAQALPLHLALRHSALPHVCRTLLGRHPASAQESDKEGMTPLALALRFGASEDVVSDIFDAWPDALRVTDTKGLEPFEWVRATELWSELYTC